MSPLASRGLGIAPAESGLSPQAQRSSKATNRGQGLRPRVEEKSLQPLV